MRTFETGATRDESEGKPDYEGYLSPLVLRRYGAYMRKHSIQADGVRRASDNWQRGIPLQDYMKSGWRHFLDWWLGHRGHQHSIQADGVRFPHEAIEEVLCALLFNVMGYLHVLLTDGAPRADQSSTRSVPGGAPDPPGPAPPA